MTTESYPGTRKHITWTCTKREDDPDDPGGLADPGDLTIVIKKPSGLTTLVWPASDQITRTSLGVFEHDVDCPAAGGYAVAARGSGAVVAAGEVSWVIERSAVA